MQINYICVCVCACARGKVWFEICLTKTFSYLKVCGKETLSMSGDISLGSSLYWSNSVFAHFNTGSEMHWLTSVLSDWLTSMLITSVLSHLYWLTSILIHFRIGSPLYCLNPALAQPRTGWLLYWLTPLLAQINCLTSVLPDLCNVWPHFWFTSVWAHLCTGSHLFWLTSCTGWLLKWLVPLLAHHSTAPRC